MIIVRQQLFASIFHSFYYHYVIKKQTKKKTSNFLQGHKPVSNRYNTQIQIGLSQKTNSITLVNWGCIFGSTIYTTSESISCSVVSDSLQPSWSAAHLTLLSIEFSRQEYWTGLSFPSAKIKLKSPTLQTDSLMCEPPGSTIYICPWGNIFFVCLFVFLSEFQFSHLQKDRVICKEKR